ncbi:MAG: ATP-binding cassette domain-containing protein [Desulfobacterales bacterium]|nr:ATP-binding cassette domain-containing protein [Desulfobacterales bacterium]
MNTQTPLVTINDVVKHFDISGGLLDQISFSGGFHLEKTTVKAVNNVSLYVNKGETLSVVGESGCGKSTLARVIMGLHPPNSGEVYYEGNRIDNLSHEQWMPYRRKMQMIFQDPYASLNPRKTVRQTLEEPLRFHNPKMTGAEAGDKIADVMEKVGVDPAWITRYPHEFSGGQRQRISIARGLILDPQFIVADEPVSALDVSIQAQILNLLMELREKMDLTYLFITHDLSVVHHISSRVAVLYLGTLCELAPAHDLFYEPRHPYTRALLSAIPKVGEKKAKHIKLKGEVPTPVNLPTGCVFHGRCVFANDRCSQEVPALNELPNGSFVACHGVEEGRPMD